MVGISCIREAILNFAPSGLKSATKKYGVIIPSLLHMVVMDSRGSSLKVMPKPAAMTVSIIIHTGFLLSDSYRRCLSVKWVSVKCSSFLPLAFFAHSVKIPRAPCTVAPRIT